MKIIFFILFIASFLLMALYTESNQENKVPKILCEDVGVGFKSISFDERSKIIKIQCENEDAYGTGGMIK